MQKQQITEYMEKCLFDVASQGVFNKIGLQGGVINPENNNLYGESEGILWENEGPLKVSYWYHTGKDISPSINQIEDNLGRYILKEAESCLKNLNNISSAELVLPDINAYHNLANKDTFIKVNIVDREVLITYIFPITLIQEKDKTTIKEFNVELPIPLGEDYKIAKSILSRMIDNKEKGYNINLDCNSYEGNGQNKVYYYKNKIIINDYETYSNKYKKTFTFQFLFSGLNVYGYCG
jgi:hypothetical protein